MKSFNQFLAVAVTTLISLGAGDYVEVNGKYVSCGVPAPMEWIGLGFGDAVVIDGTKVTCKVHGL